MQIHQDWPEIRQVFNAAFNSSSHYAVATVSPDGEPHITPIGSLILTEPGKGFYFEEFPSRLPQNLATNPQLSVLAVNSGLWFWLKSLFRGRFAQSPAVRLYGRAGERRWATEEEIAQWHKRVHSARHTKGYKILWQNMSTVRELEFHRAEPVRLGVMTQHLHG